MPLIQLGSSLYCATKDQMCVIGRHNPVNQLTYDSALLRSFIDGVELYFL